jgi:hypothetical protein
VSEIDRAVEEALTALNAAPDEFDPPDRRDRELDDPVVEALAAWALAEDDPEGTRAYWRWYVTEAFPAAYAGAD